MKKKIAYFSASCALAVGVAFSAYLYAPSKAAVQSCQGKCKRAYNACVAGGNTPPSCNAAYQGCISSCK